MPILIAILAVLFIITWFKNHLTVLFIILGIIAAIVLIGFIATVNSNKKDEKAKKEAEDKRLDDIRKQNEEITKRNEDISVWNANTYPVLVENRRYTLEKIEELFNLLEPLQEEEINDTTAKTWDAQLKVINWQSNAYLPYEQEYYSLEKEFGNIDDSTLNEIANLLLTHRVETIKEAYDVIEMRDHNAKMEAIAKDAARAEEIARQEAREREIIAEREADIRAAAERKWREQEQRERDQRAKEDHERRVKNYTKACDQLERAQYSPLGEFAKESARRKKDKAYAELMGR